MKNCLVLVQYRNEDKIDNTYNDFIGKFYHFPGNDCKSYLKQFEKLPIEFIYYEPAKNGGRGEYFGYGKITKAPFPDKREQGYYFVEIEDYKPFGKPVSYAKENGEHREKGNPSYNAQNSVRQIPEDILEEICLEGEIQLNFQVDAHLIKVLGEQLIGSEKVGVLELIKNAYDAGATKCTVRIENSSALSSEAVGNQFPDLQGPVIVVEDNGSGMTKDVIENGWLRPASTLKTDVKEKLKIERTKAETEGTLAIYDTLLKKLKEANNGRIPLGEKGVGRFATHRLGKYLILKTKVAYLDYEYVLEINWDNFDEINGTPLNLDSIGVSLKKQKVTRDYGETNSGTQIVIYGGREGFLWTEEKVRDLYNSILQLNSPNPNPSVIKPKFSVKLIVPQLPKLEEEDIFEGNIPPFEFFGLVDEKGNLSYDMKFQSPPSVPLPSETMSGNINLLDQNKDYWKKENRYPKCGAFYIHLKLWYRTEPWITGPNAKRIKDYLEEYGGISIYRDTINIFPAEWGAQNDWLELSKPHIKQGWRLSYYNMIGNVEIDQGNNLNITDKTNREGLIENEAYLDLKVLIQTIINTEILNCWVGIRNKYNDLSRNIIRNPKELRNYTQQVLDLNKSIQENYPIEEDPFNILGKLGLTAETKKVGLINLSNSMKNLRDSIRVMEEVQGMLTEQAGYGLAIAVSVHEINKITSNFYNGISAILKSGSFDVKKLEELKDSSSSLRSELKRLSPLRALRSEKKSIFNIVRPLKYVLEIYKKDLDKLNIEFMIEGDIEGFEIAARYGALVQIFTNLIDNACYWLGTLNDCERKIIVSVDKTAKIIIFADNGPGIHESIRPYLFNPGYSMKVPRSGLGLYISKYYMTEMKGDIQSIYNEKFRIKNYKGAQFLLDFSKASGE